MQLCALSCAALCSRACLPLIARHHESVQAECPCACAGDFANSSAGGTFEEADGHWLHQPTAVLRAKDESGMVATSALLSLAQPRYDADHHTLTFQVQIYVLQSPEDILCGVGAAAVHHACVLSTCACARALTQTNAWRVLMHPCSPTQPWWVHINLNAQCTRPCN